MQYYTTKDVIDKHHFTTDFLNKCLKRLNQIFQGRITRGNNNARLFDSEAMNIFDIIAQRKQDGQSIAEIEAFLLQGYQPITTQENKDINPVITWDTTTPKTTEADIFKMMNSLTREPIKTDNNQNIEPVITAIKNLVHIMDNQQKELQEERIRQTRLYEALRVLDKENTMLKNSMKLLTDGRNPEQVKKDWQDEQKRLIQIQEKFLELQSLGFMQWRKQRQLLKELAKLTKPD